MDQGIYSGIIELYFNKIWKGSLQPLTSLLFYFTAKGDTNLAIFHSQITFATLFFFYFLFFTKSQFSFYKSLVITLFVGIYLLKFKVWVAFTTETTFITLAFIIFYYFQKLISSTSQRHAFLIGFLLSVSLCLRPTLTILYFTPILFYFHPIRFKNTFEKSKDHLLVLFLIVIVSFFSFVYAINFSRMVPTFQDFLGDFLIYIFCFSIFIFILLKFIENNISSNDKELKTIISIIKGFLIPYLVWFLPYINSYINWFYAGTFFSPIDYGRSQQGNIQFLLSIFKNSFSTWELSFIFISIFCFIIGVFIRTKIKKLTKLHYFILYQAITPFFAILLTYSHESRHLYLAGIQIIFFSFILLNLLPYKIIKYFLAFIMLLLFLSWVKVISTIQKDLSLYQPSEPYRPTHGISDLRKVIIDYSNIINMEMASTIAKAKPLKDIGIPPGMDIPYATFHVPNGKEVQINAMFSENLHDNSFYSGRNFRMLFKEQGIASQINFDLLSQIKKKGMVNVENEFWDNCDYILIGMVGNSNKEVHDKKTNHKELFGDFISFNYWEIKNISVLPLTFQKKLILFFIGKK